MAEPIVPQFSEKFDIGPERFLKLLPYTFVIYIRVNPTPKKERDEATPNEKGSIQYKEKITKLIKNKMIKIKIYLND